MRVGLVGWRGMVGSVLMTRMVEESDFDLFEARFFSTSNAGGMLPGSLASLPKVEPRLYDASDLSALQECDVVLTCQGSDYTKQVYEPLRQLGWSGYWIDAAKTLRMNDDAIIVLDPVNQPVIDQALNKGIKNFIGGNCTVSCMLMGVGALYKEGLVEFMTATTYQAASGGGAQHMRELLSQMGTLNASVRSLLDDPASAILEIDRQVLETQQKLTPEQTQHFLVPLAGSLIPWIDADRGDGTSLEEWKGGAETNKILGRGPGFDKSPIPIDSICVRIGAMRCHSQSLMFKLTKDVPLKDIEQMIAEDNPWVRLVPNTKEESIHQLTPIQVTGSLNIAVGRLRKLAMGEQYLGAFTIGDQLLWGAAEPLRRMLRILLKV
ncbi:MAG: aspartate-semialdehyde dehydrogenase [Burkholderiaceae bacterium]